MPHDAGWSNLTAKRCSKSRKKENIPLTKEQRLLLKMMVRQVGYEVLGDSINFYETKPFSLKALPLRPQIRQRLRPQAEKRCLRGLGRPAGAGVRAEP